VPSPTRFGSLASYEKDHVEPIADDVRRFLRLFDCEVAIRMESGQW
jgi:hypothetical protein